MCAQEKLCVIKIIKVIDRISRAKLDPFNFLQIDKEYFLRSWCLTAIFNTVKRIL